MFYTIGSLKRWNQPENTPVRWVTPNKAEHMRTFVWNRAPIPIRPDNRRWATQMVNGIGAARLCVWKCAHGQPNAFTYTRTPAENIVPALWCAVYAVCKRYDRLPTEKRQWRADATDSAFLEGAENSRAILLQWQKSNLWSLKISAIWMISR